MDFVKPSNWCSDQYECIYIVIKIVQIYWFVLNSKIWRILEFVLETAVEHELIYLSQELIFLNMNLKFDNCYKQIADGKCTWW